MVGVIKQKQCASELAHSDLYSPGHVIELLIDAWPLGGPCDLCCPLSVAFMSRVERYPVCREGATALRHEMRALQYPSSEDRSAWWTCRRQKLRHFQRGVQTSWTRRNSSRSGVICASPSLFEKALTKSCRSRIKEASTGYFYDLHMTRVHGGKTWMAPNVLIREDVRSRRLIWH